MKIIEKAGLMLASLAVVGAGAVAVVQPVSAVTCPASSLRTSAKTLAQCNTYNPDADSDVNVMDTAKRIINMVLGVIGFVAVVMVIVGGFQYATSSGDAAKVTKAKNTIMYGIIGMVIALLAYAIVNFVLDQIFNQGQKSE